MKKIVLISILIGIAQTASAAPVHPMNIEAVSYAMTGNGMEISQTPSVRYGDIVAQTPSVQYGNIVAQAPSVQYGDIIAQSPSIAYSNIV